MWSVIQEGLSTPVPEEGLPRGSASAAEGDEPGDEDDTEGAWRNLALQFDGHRIKALSWLKAMVADPAEHREGAAAFLAAPPLSGEKVLAKRIAALPSPLSSQGEPVAVGYINPDYLARLKDGTLSACNVYTAEDRLANDVPLYTAEALAAAEARADRAEEALKPFAGDTMPSLRRTEVAFDRTGLRRSMSPMEIAMLRARTILKETPDEA